MIDRSFVRNTALASATLLAVCGLAHAQQNKRQGDAPTPPAAMPQVVTESVKLRYQKPSELVRFIMRPDLTAKPGTANRSFVTGLKQFVPNDVAGTVTVSGSAETLKEYKAIITFLDVAPRTLRLKIRLLHYEFAADTKPGDAPRVTELANTEADTVSNTPVELSLVAGEALLYGNIVPHVNGDGSVSLGTKMRITTEPEEVDWKTVPGRYRTLQTGDTFLFLDGGADRSRIISDATRYERLKGVNAGYYLEVTPLVDPAAGKD